jgi:YidC/Oxa1 family membrane protein insertase
LIEAISQVLVNFLVYIHNYTGNYGWAIIVFSVIMKIVLYYPTQSQFKSMKEMQKVQPELKEIQKKFKDNPQKLQTEQMALFKRHNINPLGGCLPILIQMPVLWGIFVAIRKMAESQMFGSETFLWIGGPLSKLYPKWIASSLADHDLPLVVLYGFSMYLSQKLTVSDPATEGTQKMMSIIMPIAFTFIMWNFPSALILYWLMFNIFSIVQQYFVMRQADEEIPLKMMEAGQQELLPSLSPGEENEKEKIVTETSRSRSRSRKKKGGK